MISKLDYAKICHFFILSIKMISIYTYLILFKTIQYKNTMLVGFSEQDMQKWTNDMYTY